MKTWPLKRLSLFSLLLVLVGLSLSSCKKERFNPNNTGKDVLPNEDILGLNTIDTTITIFTKPVWADSIRTDEVSTTALLGSYVDPVFGKTEAAIYAQLRISVPVDFTSIDGAEVNINDVQVDSVRLTIPYSSLYGKNDPQTFEVFQLTEELFLDSNYFSNRSILHTGTNLIEAGKETVTANESENTITLHLDKAIGEAIVAEDGNPTLQTKSEFAKWFKGLYIGVNNTAQTSGSGAIFSAGIGQEGTTTMTIYYSDVNESSRNSSFDLYIDGGAAYFSAFSHDFTGTGVESAVNNPNLGQNAFYVQPMQGVNTEVAFPYINNLNTIENIIIRKAELILPYVEDNLYTPLSSLLVLNYNKAGETVFIVDQFTGNIGGTRNASEENYTLNITNYVNRLLKGDIDDERLLLVPVGAAVAPNRTVFNGQSSTSDNKIKLKISYSTY